MEGAWASVGVGLETYSQPEVENPGAMAADNRATALTGYRNLWGPQAWAYRDKHCLPPASRADLPVSRA